MFKNHRLFLKFSPSENFPLYGISRIPCEILCFVFGVIKVASKTISIFIHADILLLVSEFAVVVILSE